MQLQLPKKDKNCAIVNYKVQIAKQKATITFFLFSYYVAEMIFHNWIPNSFLNSGIYRV